MLRRVAGTLGVVVMGFGAWLLFGAGDVRDPSDVIVWLAGAIILHDGLVAPLVLAVGFLLAALPARGLLRAALITCGALTLIALPPLARPGVPTNPSALPLDYLRNWLVSVGVVAALTAVALVLHRAARMKTAWPPGRRSRDEKTGQSDRDDRSE